jgi:hypothetical protein
MTDNKTHPASGYAFRSGQVWQWNDSAVQIKLVGKTLVHYRHYRRGIKRPPVQLSNKKVLERLLQENDATLHLGPMRPALTSGGNPPQFGRNARDGADFMVPDAQIS